MKTTTALVGLMTILLTASNSAAAGKPSNYVLPVKDFLRQCSVSEVKSSVDTFNSTGESLEVVGSKQKKSLRQYAAELVRSMSKGTPDEKTKAEDIVFTDFYQFPDVYPSAINEMASISHSFRVAFRAPSGAEYFFHIVTPTYKLINLNLPPHDAAETDGTEGSFIDTGTTSLAELKTNSLCQSMKIDSSGDGRLGR
ncbi:MAG: hypothetical protein NDI61_07750 [Bdellovibrionaceae bacterium]|nr:hypothetical protein [Pseudobdellovibrionaceae bacterium]